YLCDSTLYLHCLHEDTEIPTKWGALELYLELPLTTISVIAIALSYSLIVLVLRQQSRKMRHHSRAKVKPSQVVPVTSCEADVSKTTKDNAKYFLAQESKHAANDEVSRQTERTDSRVSCSHNSPHQTEEVPCPAGMILVGECKDLKMNLNIQHYEAHAENIHQLCKQDLEVIAENASAVEMNRSEYCDRKPSLDNAISKEKTIKRDAGFEECKSVSTKNLQTGVYLNETGPGLSCLARPDSPFISHVIHHTSSSSRFSSYTLKYPPLHSFQHWPSSRRASYHGFINNECINELPNKTRNITSRNDSTSNLCCRSQLKDENKSSQNPFSRAMSEFSILLRPSINYSKFDSPREILFLENMQKRLDEVHVTPSNFRNGFHSTTLTAADTHSRGASDVCGHVTCSEVIHRHTSTSEDEVIQSKERRSNPKTSTLNEASGNDKVVTNVNDIESEHGTTKNSSVQTLGNVDNNFDLKTVSIETKRVPADFTNNVILRDTLSSASEKKGISLNGSKEETFKNSSCVTPKHAPNAELDQSGLISNTDLSLHKDKKNIMKNISIVHARDNASAAAGALTDGKTINGKIEDGKMIEVVEMDGTVHVTVQTEASVGQIDGAVCLMNPKNKEQGRRRVELKAALKVGLLFCSCVCLWAPLPALVVYMRETSGWRDKLKVDLLVIFSALATSTAAMDPIVYGLLNRQIRIAAFAAGRKLRKKIREKFRNEL
ncbi:Octopamine receptor, partial [Biomphalaria pfeifferi]